MAMPGTYSVTLSKRVEGKLEEIAAAQNFVLKPLFSGGLVTDDRQALLDFETKSGELYAAVTGANGAMGEIQSRIDHLIKAVLETPTASEEQAQALRALNTRMQILKVKLSGDQTLTGRSEPAPMSITARINNIVGGHWNSEAAVTKNYSDSFAIAARQFGEALPELKSIAADLAGVEAKLQAEGAPWTPGRIPDWQ